MLIAAALLALWPVAAAVLPNGAPVGIVVQGIVLGTANGLLAIGLILIYRTNRIVNFAYGSLGSVAGLFGVQLYLKSGWNYFAAMGLAVALGLVLGGIVEFVVIRRFTKSSRLVLTVATIGLAQVLGGMELLLPTFFGGQAGPLGGFASPMRRGVLTIEPVIFTGDHVLILVIVPVVIGALTWFLGRTDAGIAMRAAAENLDRARLLGIPVAKLSTLVWVVGGGLSALTYVLTVPSKGAVPTGLAGPGLLLPALAAAVLARMHSLPVAFFAAIGLGALEQVVFWSGNVPSAADVVFLLVILGGLLFRRDRMGRLSDMSSSWTDTAVARPVPFELRRLPEVRIAKVVLYGLLAVAAIAAPFVYGSSATTTLSLTLVWAMVGGLAGRADRLGRPHQPRPVRHRRRRCRHGREHGEQARRRPVRLAARRRCRRRRRRRSSSACRRCASGASSSPSPRWPSPSPSTATSSTRRTSTVDPEPDRPSRSLAAVPAGAGQPMYFLCLAFLVLSAFLARGVRRARAGRVLIASRDNRRAAEAASVPTTGVVLSGFVFSGILAGIAGGLHVIVLHGARIGSYQPVQSLEVFSMAVIGGLGSVGGVLLGVFSLRALQDVSAEYRLLITGTSLLAVLLVVPGGLGQVALNVRDRFLRFVANRRGLLVPEPGRRRPLRARTRQRRGRPSRGRG